MDIDPEPPPISQIIELFNGSNFEIVIALISLFVICPSFLYNESANPTEFV